MATNWIAGSGGDFDFQQVNSWSNGVPTLANIGSFSGVSASFVNVPSTAFAVSASTSAIDFGEATLHATTVLSTSDASTYQNFTQLRTSGQQAKYATVTGGVEQSHLRGSTISFTYDTSFGFSPDQVTSSAILDDFTASSGSGSFTIDPTCLAGQYDIALSSSTNGTTLNLDTITVLAVTATLTQATAVAGTTISGTYANYTPDHAFAVTIGSTALTSFVASAGAWSATVPLSLAGTNPHIFVNDVSNTNSIDTGQIEITAPASGAKSSRLSLGLSLGL